ncbi:MAG: phosphate acyltransferase PlsX [Actinobacteria bacterium]|nr:phosphate acyltransferase PlsX [Actinomycetota bacterium]
MTSKGRRPPPDVLATLPVAVDAMGGDRAPEEIVGGSRDAVEKDEIQVVLVGKPDQLSDIDGLDVVACSEVIAMDEDPAGGVRRKKDSSLVRCAELVRDGRACAMVSAGNTGATMASALLRMGRCRGVVRPCIATPLPRLGGKPAVLVDAGANAECTSAMLVQFAQMGSAFSNERYGIEQPTVGLLSIGEEPTKGTPLVKETHALLSDGSRGINFIGNVEGRELLQSPADVVVTDGFTGNVALKALEGALRFMFDTVAGVFSIDDAAREASGAILPHLLSIASVFDPENTGGAMLLGVNGVCVISHGSSSSVAIRNAIRVAHDLAAGGVVDRIAESISPAD